MNKNKKIGLVVVAIGIIIVIGVILARPPKINHTYEPVTDLTRVRDCITQITGNPNLDIEALNQDQVLFADVYRFCLKTVDDIEAALKELAQ